jgi:flagellar hook-associated protein 3 FlgL
MDLANTKDAEGNYIFAGSQTNTQPYSHNSVYGGATAPQATTYAGDATARYAQIDANHYVQTNDTLTGVMGAGTASDLLQTIDNLAAGLNNGTATQAAISNAFAVLTSARSNLRVVEANVAGRQVDISSTQTSIQSQLNADQSALGKIKTLDQAAAIIELQTRQTSLQAAEQAFSLTSKQSLFNYL